MTALRAKITAWFSRHEVAWELVMASLAVVYVALDTLADAGWLGASVFTVDALITVFFLAEFLVRCWAAVSRRRYVSGPCSTSSPFCPPPGLSASCACCGWSDC